MKMGRERGERERKRNREGVLTQREIDDGESREKKREDILT